MSTVKWTILQKQMNLLCRGQVYTAEGTSTFAETDQFIAQRPNIPCAEDKCLLCRGQLSIVQGTSAFAEKYQFIALDKCVQSAEDMCLLHWV